MAAIDRAIAKLDEILASLGKGGTPTPAAAVPSAQAAKSKPAAAPPAAAAAPATPAAAGASSSHQLAPEARDILINKVQLKVARLVSVEPQANSDKLLKMQADLGGGDTRQIMAGLQQFLTPQQLQGALVVVVANLKPAKLAGEPSQAMVLAASCSSAAGELVRPLVPPEGSAPGDLVHLDGSCIPATYPKVLKSDDWKKVVHGLVVQRSKATFDGTPFMTAAGVVTLPGEIVDGAEIH